MSFFNRKRFGIIGLSVIAIVAALVVGVGGGVALGDFMFQNQTTGHIGTVGSNANVYADPACTQLIPSNGSLPSGLGVVNLDLTTPKSGTISVYFRNEGQTRLNPQISVTGMASGFTMTEATLGALSATSVPLMGVSGFQPNGLPSTPNLGPSDASLFTDLTPGGAIPAALPQQGHFKWENEIVRYGSWSGGTLHGLTRGQLGTAITSHPTGALLVYGELTTGTLAPNQVKPIVLTIVADPSVKVGSAGSDFILNVVAGAGTQ